MQAISPLNIESELSYAYLHAVASMAGMSCSPANRHDDNNGVDATVTAWGPFTGGGYLEEVDIKFQLKATIGTPVDDGIRLSYFLKEVKRYDDLRADTVSTLRILVVLFLPEDPTEWLGHSDTELALRKCAYWQSLRGAPATRNKSGETIYLPKSQSFSPDAITALAARLSLLDFPLYPTA